MQSQADLGEQGAQQRAEDTPLGDHCFKSQCGGGVVTHPHNLWSARQEVQDPVAEGGIQPQTSELGVELGANNGVAAELKSIKIILTPSRCSSSSGISFLIAVELRLTSVLTMHRKK